MLVVKEEFKDERKKPLLFAWFIKLEPSEETESSEYEDLCCGPVDETRDVVEACILGELPLGDKLVEYEETFRKTLWCCGSWIPPNGVFSSDWASINNL